MAKITRIKASDPGKSPEKPQKAPTSDKKVKQPQDTAKAKKSPETAKNSQKPTKKPFILIRPLVYLGRYIRDSWHETRQVRWPSRKATWKLFFAVLIYTLLFVGIIMLLDALFTWLFGLFIG